MVQIDNCRYFLAEFVQSPRTALTLAGGDSFRPQPFGSPADNKGNDEKSDKAPDITDIGDIEGI